MAGTQLGLPRGMASGRSAGEVSVAIIIPRLDEAEGFRHKNHPRSFTSPSPQSSMKLRLALALAVFSLAHFAFAGPRFLNCDYNGGHVSIVAADGSIEWQVDAKSPQDCWLLPNGNILFAYLNG